MNEEQREEIMALEAIYMDEFAKLDTDKSGYITKDEMVTVISSEFQGDKVSVLNKLN